MIDPLDDPDIEHRRLRTKQAIMDTLHEIGATLRKLSKYSAPISFCIVILFVDLLIVVEMSDIRREMKLTDTPYWMTFALQVSVQVGCLYCIENIIRRYFRRRR